MPISHDTAKCGSKGCLAAGLEVSTATPSRHTLSSGRIFTITHNLTPGLRNTRNGRSASSEEVKVTRTHHGKRRRAGRGVSSGDHGIMSWLCWVKALGAKWLARHGLWHGGRLSETRFVGVSLRLPGAEEPGAPPRTFSSIWRALWCSDARGDKSRANALLPHQECLNGHFQGQNPDFLK